MDYLKIDEVAAQWGISSRRLQSLCAQGKIKGATRFGRAWMIPKNAQKPIDARTKAGREAMYMTEKNMPLPRKTPFLYMTNLYNTPGCADKVIASLEDNPKAQKLFFAELACAKGDIDKVYENVSYLLERNSDFYYTLALGTLLAQCAIWCGDLEMWRRAKIYISEAEADTDAEREIITLCICVVDSMVYDVKFFPDWFKTGFFELLHKDTLPAAKVYYTRYIYAIAHALASQTLELSGVQGLALMRLLPGTIEPMISQAVADKTVIAEIHLRLISAAVHRYNKNDKLAYHHIDKAVALALPDKLYGVLAEHCRLLVTLLEQRVRAVDESAWIEINRLYRIYLENWSKFSSEVTGRQIVASLSDQQRECARLASFKLSDVEIAETTHMSLSSVKQALRNVREKSGLSRSEFAAIL